jgi:hypothetical protein
MRGKEFNELGYTITKLTDIGLHYRGSIPGEVWNPSFRQYVWFPAISAACSSSGKLPKRELQPALPSNDEIINVFEFYLHDPSMISWPVLSHRTAVFCSHGNMKISAS